MLGTILSVAALSHCEMEDTGSQTHAGVGGVRNCFWSPKSRGSEFFSENTLVEQCPESNRIRPTGLRAGWSA